MLSAKVEAMLRNLPKPRRRQFSPLRQFAMAAVEAIDERAQPLPVAVAGALASITGVSVDASEFDETELAEHLRMNIRVLDLHGNVCGESRSLESLRQELLQAAANRAQDLDWGICGRSNGAWAFESLPNHVTCARDGVTLVGYPGLCLVSPETSDDIVLEVFEDEARAENSHREACTRMLSLSARRACRRLLNEHPDTTRVGLLAVAFGHRENPIEHLIANAVGRATISETMPRSEATFGNLSDSVINALKQRLPDQIGELANIFERGKSLLAELESNRGLPEATRENCITQVRSLLSPMITGIFGHAAAARLWVYFRGIEKRIERAAGNPGKDFGKLTKAPTPTNNAMIEPLPERCEEYWSAMMLLEEFRLSLFAPELGAAFSVGEDQLCTAVNTLVELGAERGATPAAFTGQPSRPLTGIAHV